jgi:hypothetical protein
MGTQILYLQPDGTDTTDHLALQQDPTAEFMYNFLWRWDSIGVYWASGTSLIILSTFDSHSRELGDMFKALLSKSDSDLVNDLYWG